MYKKLLIIALLFSGFYTTQTTAETHSDSTEQTSTQPVSVIDSSTKKSCMLLFNARVLALLTSGGAIAHTLVVSPTARSFIAKLATSSTTFLATVIGSLYFASPNAHPEHDGIKITINGKTFVHKKDATEWIFDVEQLKPVRNRLMTATAITGALGILTSAYCNNEALNTVTLSTFLGSLAACGIVVGLEVAMNATDDE